MNESSVLRLLVPNAAAGSVIGKAGVNIKEISSNSGANLKFANKNDMITGIYERVVTVVGNERQQLDCTKMILNTMYSDDERTSKSQYYNPTVNYSRRMDSRHGGGYHHPILMKDLKKYINIGSHLDLQTIGIHQDNKEALLIAILALCKYLDIPSNMSSVTGSKGDIILGDILV